MQKFFLSFLFILLSLSNSFAKELLADSKNRSIGGSVGDIWAVTYQMPYRDKNILALSAGIGNHGFLAIADILWFQPEFKQLRGFKPYLATGAGVRTDKNDFSNDTALLIRTPIGGIYPLKNRSMDLFGHIAPQIDSRGGTYLNLQIGLHYIY